MFSQIGPRKGHGFTGFPPGAGISAGDVGSITYANAAPNTNYLAANGQSVLVADYPVFYQQTSRVPSFYTKRQTGPASGAPSAAATTDNIAISPNGNYFATRYDPVSSDMIYLFKISGGALTALSTLGMTGLSRDGVSMAFTDGDRHVVSFTGTAPYLHVFARTPGTDTFSPTILTGSPAAVGTVVGPIAITADDVIIGAVAGSPFINGSQISGATVVTKSTGMPTIHAAPTRIVRTKDGSRFAMSFASAPYVRVFDYAAGVFTEISGAAPAVSAAPVDIAISPTGEWIAVVSSTLEVVTLWRSSGASAYVFAVARSGANETVNKARFTQDGVYLVIVNTNAGSLSVFEVANGAFLGASRGGFSGLGTNLAQLVFARNADFMAQLDTATPWFRVFGADATPLSVPLPACPVQGSGDSLLIPFVKVK